MQADFDRLKVPRLVEGGWLVHLTSSCILPQNFIIVTSHTFLVLASWGERVLDSFRDGEAVRKQRDLPNNTWFLMV